VCVCRYLGWNYITVIEGLDKLRNLEELHIQNQQLPQGETIHFDPRTMEGLSVSLPLLPPQKNCDKLHVVGKKKFLNFIPHIL
jgi:hypothetical protein